MLEALQYGGPQSKNYCIVREDIIFAPHMMCPHAYLRSHLFKQSSKVMSCNIFIYPLLLTLIIHSVRCGSIAMITKENGTSSTLDFDYEDGEKAILDDLTDDTGRQLPALPPLIVPPHIPSIFDSFPTLPPIGPANLCANWYALCFTILYGARKCCIGIVCPPFGIVCDPNEKSLGSEEEFVDATTPSPRNGSRTTDVQDW
ncbi:unnamed protein product [Allacma fusca]|uniref:Uncharacterized protein n=1 Tax=Allacma fusca TaxID=39272 RepID=A0A8J2J8M7_9HEXA|nr:unnamed protein product [Allacma fusca]